MGAGIHVRIDAQGNACFLTHSGGNGAQYFQLGLRFDVETQNVLFKRKGQLAPCFANPGEKDLGGGDADRKCPAQLALRDHIGPGTHIGQKLQDCEVGIGLHGIANQCRDIGKGVGEDAKVALQSCF